MDNSDGAAATPADAARGVKDAASTADGAADLLVEGGKQLASDAAQKGADRATSMADSTSSALRRAADGVEGDNRIIGIALRRGADTIEQAAQALHGGDVLRVVGDLNGFARRQPSLFLGACIALGFALARVSKTAIETGSDTADRTMAPVPEI